MDSEKKVISGDERDFCNLLVYGCEPFGGDPARCYQEIFHDKSNLALMHARELLNQPHIKEYVEELRKNAGYMPEEVKDKIASKLMVIMDECSHGTYQDRRGTELSPAALRSVAVNAAKALMELFPVKVASESKLMIGDGEEGGKGGVVINVIAPPPAPAPEDRII